MAVVGVLVLLAVVGATAYMMRHQSVDAAAPQPSQTKPKAILHLESFVVNLADRDEKTFLRLGLDLGVGKEIGKKEGASVGESSAPVRDAVIGVLTSYHAEELLTPDGKQQMKTNLLKALNEQVPELNVQQIYFTDFLVQR